MTSANTLKSQVTRIKKEERKKNERRFFNVKRVFLQKVGFQEVKVSSGGMKSRVNIFFQEEAEESAHFRSISLGNYKIYCGADEPPDILPANNFST